MVIVINSAKKTLTCGGTEALPKIGATLARAAIRKKTNRNPNSCCSEIPKISLNICRLCKVAVKLFSKFYLEITLICENMLCIKSVNISRVQGIRNKITKITAAILGMKVKVIS